MAEFLPGYLTGHPGALRTLAVPLEVNFEVTEWMDGTRSAVERREVSQASPTVCDTEEWGTAFHPTGSNSNRIISNKSSGTSIACIVNGSRGMKLPRCTRNSRTARDSELAQ
jgi:hypothetical protein